MEEGKGGGDDRKMLSCESEKVKKSHQNVNISQMGWNQKDLSGFILHTGKIKHTNETEGLNPPWLL